MFRFVLLIISAFIINFNAYAWMPTYDDDHEFESCTKSTKDWSFCAQEEGLRVLNNVKKQYRAILTNPKIVDWHSKLDENTAVMRDMYESWTAFRNRICSLSVKAAENLQPLVDPRAACDLFHIQHHQDHLDKVLLLLQGNVPDDYNDFEFLQIIDHDKEYQQCIEAEDEPESIIKSKEEVLNEQSAESTKEVETQVNAQDRKEKCVEEELKRSIRNIKNYYKTFVNDEIVGKWNNGDGLKQGNYRDMYDSWIAYRNRMCALAVWAYQSHYGTESISSNDCILFYNLEKFEIMQNTLIGAHSSLDEEDIPDMNANDGGEAEGKTITPLKRRIAVEEQTEDERFSEEDKENTENNKEEKSTDNTNESLAKQEVSPQNNVPSWANPQRNIELKQNSEGKKPDDSKKIPAWADKK
ncbi:MAG: DUF1311 domain-containing protein [Alphaproteobacteria bacterium]|nr:DUF1311 domain-containing protein [Alphaproteobacteria bacterium]